MFRQTPNGNWRIHSNLVLAGFNWLSFLRSLVFCLSFFTFLFFLFSSVVSFSSVSLFEFRFSCFLLLLFVPRQSSGAVGISLSFSLVFFGSLSFVFHVLYFVFCFLSFLIVFFFVFLCRCFDVLLCQRFVVILLPSRSAVLYFSFLGYTFFSAKWPMPTFFCSGHFGLKNKAPTLVFADPTNYFY